MRPPTKMLGRRFGSLTVMALAGRSPRRWHCRCDCGVEKVFHGGNLQQGLSTSCGCRRREAIATSGGKTRHPLYSTWKQMAVRCYLPGSRDFDYYGQRGIEVCKRWRLSFDAFVADMGERPEGTTLDRKDVDGNYEPGNCRWASTVEQNQNKTNTRLGHERAEQIRALTAQGLSAREIHRRLGFHIATIMSVRSGRSWKRAA